jgi:hypothetical protein
MNTSSKGSHEWIIEFEKAPSDLNKFILILDNTLKSVNSDYEAKRFKDLNLILPVIKAVPKGTFNKWLKTKDKLGGQNKVPRLSNSREYIEDLYRLQGSTYPPIPLRRDYILIFKKILFVIEDEPPFRGDGGQALIF